MNKYLWPHFEDAGNKHDSHMQPELTVNAYPNCLCETKQTQHHDIHTHTHCYSNRKSNVPAPDGHPLGCPEFVPGPWTL